MHSRYKKIRKFCRILPISVFWNLTPHLTTVKGSTPIETGWNQYIYKNIYKKQYIHKIICLLKCNSFRWFGYNIFVFFNRVNCIELPINIHICLRELVLGYSTFYFLTTVKRKDFFFSYPSRSPNSYKYSSQKYILSQLL